MVLRRSYLTALVATGKIWQLNLGRLVSLLRGPTSASHSSTTHSGGSHSTHSGSLPATAMVRNDPSAPFVVQMLAPKQSWFALLMKYLFPLALLVYMTYQLSSLLPGSGSKSGGGAGLPFNMKTTHSRAEKSTTHFDDVKGVDEAIDELREIVEYLRNPAQFEKFGANMPRGVLLSGPPGTGERIGARVMRRLHCVAQARHC
jgi:ATP-dependent Zn protease